MVMIQSTVVMANDLQSPLEGHWVRTIPEVLNHVEDKTFESMTVYADQNDYAVFEVLKKK